MNMTARRICETTNRQVELERTLKSLVRLGLKEHTRERARRKLCVIGRLLVEERSRCTEREWNTWLEENLHRRTGLTRTGVDLAMRAWANSPERTARAQQA